MEKTYLSNFRVFTKAEIHKMIARLHENETEQEVLEDNKKWNSTFASSPRKLIKLASEAREEIRIGRISEMVFTEDGKIKPE